MELLREIRRDILDGDAEEAAHDLAGGHQAVHDVAREVGGDGEADALEAAAAAEDRGVEADQAALHVDERAARVARVDGRIGLDEVLVVESRGRPTGRWR